jgi:CRP/FNR family cyclic AMP-dependent transcriptional regulator
MTAAEQLVVALGSNPLFAHLTDDEIEQIAAVARLVSYAPGEVILRQGKSSQNLWIVLEGECEVVRIVDHGAGAEEVLLASIKPPDCFGEMSFFHAAPHSANVRAKTAVQLVRIAREDFQVLIHNGSCAAYKIAYNALGRLAERLRRMDDWVAQLLAESGRKNRAREWHQFREAMLGEWSV